MRRTFILAPSRCRSAFIACIAIVCVAGLVGLVGPAGAQATTAKSTPRTFAAGDWLGLRYGGKKHFPSTEAWQNALARAYFDAPIIDAALGLLRTEFVKTEAMYDEARAAIKATKGLLDKYVLEQGGALLRAEAARRFLTGTAADRTKAQLVLARYKKVPADIVKQVQASPLLAHRAWAAWCNTDGPQGEVTSDPTLFKRGATAPALTQNPIAQVAAQLRERLLIPKKKLAGYKEEFQDGYHKTFVPNLARLPELFPRERWWHVDFDGDHVAELFINGSIPDGWNGHEVTMILRWSASAARWTLAYLRSWDTCERGYGAYQGASDVVVADFDGDGRPEVAEHTNIVAGWCWEQVHYFDEGRLTTPAHFHARGVRVARLPHDPRPVVVTRSSHNPTGGGKAAYLLTALATELRVTRWNGPTAETATVLVHGHGW